MHNLVIIIQINKFVIKYLDVSQMMDIVFLMKIAILQPKINAMVLLQQVYNVFGTHKLRVALNFKLVIDYQLRMMIVIQYLIAFKRKSNVRL